MSGIGGVPTEPALREGDGWRQLDEANAKMGPAVRETSDWQRRLQQELEVAMSPRDRVEGPLGIPEVLRELDMVSGALAGVEQRAAELVVQLRDVAEPDLLLRLEKVSAERAAVAREERETVREGGLPAPRTTVGTHLRQLQQRLSELEEALAVAHHAVQL